MKNIKKNTMLKDKIALRVKGKIDNDLIAK